MNSKIINTPSPNGSSSNDADGHSTSFISTASSSQLSDDHDTAHDKMILEDAYRANSKPDKQARLDLVSRVSLSEKEVQVWFQNRRQNDRRKSRPLTSEELANLHHSGIRLVANSKDTFHHGESVLKVTHGPVSIGLGSPEETSLHHPHPHPSSSGLAMSASFDHHNSHSHHSRSLSEMDSNHHRDHQAPQHQDSSPNNSLSSSFPGTLGYLANRRRESGATPVTVNALSTPAPSSHYVDSSFTFRVDRSSPTAPSHCSTPQSQIRLSCSLDGKAELVPTPQQRQLQRDSNTPSTTGAGRSSPASQRSPNGADQGCTPSSRPRPREFRRSYSATTTPNSGGVRLPSISTLLNPATASGTAASSPSMPRGPSGRSRNVDAWESCAASQTRDELTAMAEKESNGDALARISLIRSSSNTSSNGHGNILQPSGVSKRNGDASRRPFQHGTKRAKLSRATSSLARLESTEKKDDQDIWLSPTADSDKENWSPSETRQQQQQQHRQQEPPSSAPRKTATTTRPEMTPLQDASSRRANSNLTKSSRVRLNAKDGGKAIAIFDDAVDGGKKLRSTEEVDGFMGVDVSPSKKGDMDVASSLLSLRRGNWEAPISF
ncbi:Homeobox domain [Geosmithia morbida]|uniref:Homeobox domain n=1 Tax=Geosmithia morbida TaxID=1094350 RepID=A0A9P4YSR6_9HYPO|nr:Homeobox domain [Geosmithia morbida]KAF4122436.1 Homeobox domain [Geosmithia morbida]